MTEIPLPSMHDGGTVLVAKGAREEQRETGDDGRRVVGM
jgi:hypothetical protein